MPRQKRVPNVAVTTASHIGQRQYMEDFIEVCEVADARIAMVVCDGHGGERAARFAVHRITQALRTLDRNSWDLVGVIQSVSTEWDRQCLERLGAREYPRNAADRAALFANASLTAAYESEGWSSGTTVVAVLLDVINKRGVMANLGDSRGVWKAFSVERSRVRSTRDHTPKLTDLGPLGGTVIHRSNDVPRINGDLAVGRALGDNAPSLMGSVNHGAVQKQFAWDSQELRVVLATDGAWDVINNPEVVLMKSASEVVDKALQRKTADNVTVGMIYVTYPATAHETVVKVFRS